MKYSALTWTKTIIDENLKQIRQALEQYVENPTEVAPLQQSLIWLHEVQGALTIMEMPTPALIVQTTEKVISSLSSSGLQSTDSVYDTLMSTLIYLPNYLDHLWINEQDTPLAVLPLLNKLLSLIGDKPLSAAHLFNPDLTITHIFTKAPPIPDPKLKELFQKMRLAYQKGLTAIVKTPKQPEEGLKYLQTVLQRLEQTTGQTPITQVWWITEAVIEGLLDKGLVLNNTVLNLLKQVDNELKKGAEQGNAGIKAIPPKALLNALLYTATTVSSKGKRLSEVKNVYHLGEGTAKDGPSSQLLDVLSGPDIELIKIVVTLLKDDFARVEETLDIYNRADNASVTDLTPLVQQLSDIANTLGLLGLSVQRKLILQQRKLIAEIIQGKTPPDITILLNIAESLLKVTGALDIMRVQGVHARLRLQDENLTQFWDTPQFKQVIGIAVDEAKQELTQIITPLVTFIDTKNPDETFLEIPQHLKQIEGFLLSTDHQRAAKLLAHCTRYIQKIFIKESHIPPEDKQKALADALISLELYLDTLAGNPMDAADILDNMERRLKFLLAA